MYEYCRINFVASFGFSISASLIDGGLVSDTFIKASHYLDVGASYICVALKHLKIFNVL